MERFKSEKIYPRIFAITIAIITSVIAIYTVLIISSEFSTILPLSKSGYIYIFEKACIITSLVLLIIYLLGYYGRRKSHLYNSTLILLIINLYVPVVVELMNSSFQFLPSKLAIAKICFRTIMVIAVFLLLVENRKKRDGKVQILIFGTIFTVMYIGMIVSTSYWITGGCEDMQYYWITVKEIFIKNISFLPYIFCAYFCSKNYSILEKAREKNIKG